MHVAIVGAGPAGLMAAEVLAEGGAEVDVFDTMPSVGRKFLLAGKGGLNLTHAEPYAQFAARYTPAAAVRPWLDAFGPEALRDWVHGLDIPTFVGSSGKVFPHEMKAAPLLRAWLQRLRARGVRFHMRHRWQGALQRSGSRWRLAFDRGEHEADAVLLALGGASWSRLGSEGAWQAPLRAQGVQVAPLQPSNCGFDVAGWSPPLRERHAGAPLKGIRLRFGAFDRLGEAVLTATGLEGNLVYAVSASLREAILRDGHADLTLDLQPQRDEATLAAALRSGRGGKSIMNHLREQAGLHGAKAMLLREGLDAVQWQALTQDAAATAARIKALPVRLVAMRPIDEAISSAGGVAFDALTDGLMLKALPQVYCAGEMIDWDAPTGGYLLTACLASGRQAALSCLRDTRAGTSFA
jgi:uncharacterized flavoprotein (TIGR03862 family)